MSPIRRKATSLVFAEKSTSTDAGLTAKQELLDSVKSDLKITCHPHTFHVHRSIVCPRSEYFASALSGEFKEAVSGEIELDDDPRLVNGMLEYLYTLDYCVEDKQISNADSAATATSGEVENGLSSPLSSGSYDHLSFHILMYSLAERLFIHGLKRLSKQNVERELSQRVDGDTFFAAILEIYKTTPEHDRGLRDLIVNMTIKHLALLRKGENRLTLSLESDIFTQAPKYSHELLIALMDKWTRHLSD
uniref:BTB domain-containing protein n=1 Tax=Coccidioides posadasii RMSCC 3488 TaxID=454284 RepID=A0A0J6FJB1_COCPO|nr:hypothetical protein CPAG_05257 [Coccidioides posadasii RMSCC 3488]